MRIFVVHNYYQDKGGEDVVFAQEVDALRGRHVVETFTFRNRKGLLGLWQFAWYPWNIFAVRKLMRAVEKFKPDVVHVHNTHYAVGPLLFRALHKRGIPVVLTLHNFRLLDPSASLFYHGAPYHPDLHADFPWKSVWLKVLDRSLLKTFWTAFTYYLHKKIGTWQAIDAYLTLSRFSKGLIRQSTLRIDPDRIHVKPNFVQPLPLRAARPSRQDHFVFIGRLSEEKGIESMLRAFAQADAPLKIYGDGPLRAEVIDYAARHSNIQHEGYQEKDVLTEALVSCQALIVPSICYEGMPLTILEAFASGTPVLVSDLGVLPEMVGDGVHGLHFRPNEPASIAETVLRWKNLDENTKSQISLNCHNTYLERYSPQKNVLLLESIYERIRLK